MHCQDVVLEDIPDTLLSSCDPERERRLRRLRFLIWMGHGITEDCDLRDVEQRITRTREIPYPIQLVSEFLSRELHEDSLPIMKRRLTHLKGERDSLLKTPRRTQRLGCHKSRRSRENHMESSSGNLQ